MIHAIGKSPTVYSPPEAAGPGASGRPAPSGESTLSSEQGTSCTGFVFSLLTLPFRLVGQFLAYIWGGIRSKLLCCFDHAEEKMIDWDKAKNGMEGLTEALGKENESARLKSFGSGLNQLDDVGRARFREHVIYAIAEKEHDISERVDQELWLKENDEKTKVDLDYYQNLGKPKVVEILKLAIQNFQMEIARNM